MTTSHVELPPNNREPERDEVIVILDALIADEIPRNKVESWACGYLDDEAEFSDSITWDVVSTLMAADETSPIDWDEPLGQHAQLYGKLAFVHLRERLLERMPVVQDVGELIKQVLDYETNAGYVAQWASNWINDIPKSSWDPTVHSILIQASTITRQTPEKVLLSIFEKCVAADSTQSSSPAKSNSSESL